MGTMKQTVTSYIVMVDSIPLLQSKSGAPCFMIPFGLKHVLSLPLERIVAVHIVDQFASIGR